MPIPYPNKGEKEDKYISRCISEIASEYDVEGQAYAVCKSTYDKDKMSKITDTMSKVMASVAYNTRFRGINLMAKGDDPCWDGYEMIGMSGRIFFFLLKRLAGESRAGNLILATEAHPLSDALAALSGAAFHTLPQPVNRMFPPEASTVSPSSIVVGSYGPARHEKGADILIAAIEQYLASTSRDDIVFAVQWLQDFQTPEGEWVRISEALKQDRRFFQIDHLFAPGEYAGWLAKSSLALLPYGKEYALRGSRVIIEAMIHGIPIVVAKGTTLENHGLEFGAAACCCQNSVDDLTKAIQSSIDDLTKLQEAAGRRAITATEYFSVRNFRNLLIEAF
jgi:glycosyltransferase involved in cell wall biosynthesis